jgi:hypothetical protein
MSIKDKYKVLSIQSYLCKDWLLHKHYAKRLPNIEYSFGLYDDNILKGVITYGQPPSPSLKSSICGKDYESICIELNRLVVDDDIDKNALSYFVSSSLKMLPKPKIVVSFSDKNLKHNGYIYQATNFIYTGESTNNEILVDDNGKEVHFRKFGHLRKINTLDCKLVKRRINESELNKLEIANYLKSNKNGYTNKQIDNIFGYKDTAAHWFRTDAGFSFPSVDDWIKLKEVLKFDDTFDDIMNKYEWVQDRKEQIEKMKLKKLKIEKKHRYIYFIGNKKDIKNLLNNLKLDVLPYPKGENNRYDTSYKPTTQNILF